MVRRSGSMAGKPLLFGWFDLKTGKSAIWIKKGALNHRIIAWDHRLTRGHQLKIFQGWSKGREFSSLPWPNLGNSESLEGQLDVGWFRHTCFYSCGAILSANQTIGLATREKRIEDLTLVEGFDLFCHSKTTSAVGHVRHVPAAIRGGSTLHPQHLTAIVTAIGWWFSDTRGWTFIGRLINRDHNDARKPGNQDQEIPAPTALEQVINANHWGLSNRHILSILIFIFTKVFQIRKFHNIIWVWINTY